MKKNLSVLFVVFAMGLRSLGAPASSLGQEMRELHDAWGKARVRGDVDFLEKFYGSELELNQMNGGVVSRAEDIALFAARKIIPDMIVDQDLAVKAYGDITVVSGRENLVGTYKGKTGEVSLRFTSVLLKREGRWQLVAYQATEIRPKK